MRDPEATRQLVVRAAAQLFNQHGYRATSLRDIEQASGLTKGAIYQHFATKHALELHAFDHLSNEVAAAFARTIRAQPDAPRKLRAVWAFYRQYLELGGIVPGGCPLLNAAAEADDCDPALADRCRQLLHLLRESLVRILRRGVQEGQLRADVTHPEADALFLMAVLEGGILISRLTRSPEDIALLDRQLTLWLSARMA